MRRRSLIFAPLLFVLACAPDAPPASQMPRAPLLDTMAHAPPPAAVAAKDDAGPKPPMARREPHDYDVHGRHFTDDWHWLRNKGSPEVVAYLEAENAYTEARTKPLSPLIDSLYGEMLSRVQETDSTAPVKDGAWFYYARTEKGKQYPIECRKRADKADAPEEVLIDLNEIAKHEQFVDLGARAVSEDGNLFAYALDTTGFRQFTLHVRDLKAGRELGEAIPRVDAVVFAHDPHVVFYVTEDATTKRANQVHRHTLGDDPAKDALVYEEKDDRFDVDAAKTRSREYIVVTSQSATTSEARLLSARDPRRTPVLVAPREQGHEYYVDHAGDRLFIRTNDHGKNFRLVSAPVDDAQRSRWTEIVPQRSHVMLEDVEAFADHLILRERSDAKVTLRSIDPKTGKEHPIAIPDAVYAVAWRERAVDPWFNPDFASHLYRFGYSTPTTPLAWYDEDVRTGARTLVKRQPVPNFDPTKYEAERVDATARDGTRVPVSLVHLKGAKPDGSHPLFLTGYGAYGISYDPDFDPNIVPLLDRGIVFAIAHVRGGGEMGKPWHEAGRMKNKMNTFTDFIDSAESLVKVGWAKRDQIAIEGGSAGGLLMGAVTNMRPDLWRAVIARVPFVDVIDTMLDESLPLTTSEFEEWGNPKNEREMEWMAEYSPYDNVQPKAYPPLLVETSYNDSQVMYWEPAKWVARLRATKTDDHELLLKTNMKPAGHHGLSGRYDHLRERAFEYAWLLEQLGLASP